VKASVTHSSQSDAPVSVTMIGNRAMERRKSEMANVMRLFESVSHRMIGIGSNSGDRDSSGVDRSRSQ
jgi:hypothetical protein